MRFDYGDPAKPVAAAVPARASRPSRPTPRAVELRAFITGHGQGNRDNCAEFCRRTHTFTRGRDDVSTRLLWRDDCAHHRRARTRPAHPLARAPAGARAPTCCPGWPTSAPPPRPGVTVSYEVEPYENTCRPDAPVCSCSSCPYNNQGHTAPHYQMSAVLIAYR